MSVVLHLSSIVYVIQSVHNNSSVKLIAFQREQTNFNPFT